MTPVLVAYGTTEGQTRKIAEFVADALKDHGVEVALVDCAGASATLVQPDYVAAIVCGSLHRSKYQTALHRFVRDNKAWLAAIPAAFVAVSLTAARGDAAGRAKVQDITDWFYRKLDWRPAMTHQVAGAVRYLQFGSFKRWMMQRIARRQGCDTDTSRDHEYTDWDELAKFVDQFVAGVPHLTRS